MTRWLPSLQLQMSVSAGLYGKACKVCLGEVWSVTFVKANQCKRVLWIPFWAIAEELYGHGKARSREYFLNPWIVLIPKPKSRVNEYLKLPENEGLSDRNNCGPVREIKINRLRIVNALQHCQSNLLFAFPLLFQTKLLFWIWSFNECFYPLLIAFVKWETIIETNVVYR